MKSSFRHVFGILICGFFAQLAWSAGNGQGQTGELPVVVGTGSLTVAGEVTTNVLINVSCKQHRDKDKI